MQQRPYILYFIHIKHWEKVFKNYSALKIRICEVVPIQSKLKLNFQSHMRVTTGCVS